MKKVFLPWPQKLEEKPRHTAYYSRRLVYESADDNGGLVICMLDLKTGQRSSWSVDEAEPDEVWDLLLSDCHVVVIKLGRYAEVIGFCLTGIFRQ